MCPFCNIDKEKTRLLKTGTYIFVVLSNPRLMEGHTLVIPKRHVEKISDLNKEEKKELFSTMVEFQEKIIQKISPGCDIRENYRPFQKQDNLKIDHLHIHLQPRKFEDELYQESQIHEKKVFKELTNVEAAKITQKFG